MNYKQIREALWRWMDRPTVDGRQDNLLQEMREAINQAQADMFLGTQFWWFNIQKWELNVVSNTMSYELDDWCRLPTRMWVEGTDAHLIEFISPQESDRQGLRSTSFMEAADGPYQVTFREMRKTAAKNITATVNSASTTLTRSAGDSFASTDVGRRVRVNGEPADYKISTFTNSDVVIIDKPYQSVLTESEGLTGVGSNATNAACEISPGPVWRMDFVPMPSDTQTVYYWGNARERYLLNDTDVPEIPEQWHEGIIIGAKRRLAQYLRRPLEEQQMLKGEYEHYVNKMRKVDLPMGGAKRLTYESSFKSQYSPIRNRHLPNDVWRSR